MELEYCILCFQEDGAVVEEILNDAVLAFADVLECPDIDGLMIVVRQESFLNAMNPRIRHNDDVEGVCVESNEKFPLDEREEKE